jgi:hypothetical protein
MNDQPVIAVIPGDPHNDQLAAQTREDLAQHVDSASEVLRQCDDHPAATAALATALNRNTTTTRPRLASLLAAALIQLADLAQRQVNETRAGDHG